MFNKILNSVVSTEITLTKRSKVAGIHLASFKSADNKFTISFSEEYSGAGVQQSAQLYFLGFFPIFLSKEQENVLINNIQGYLVENVYGKI